MSDTKLQLSSGFAFDYENLFGDGKVTVAEIEALDGAPQPSRDGDFGIGLGT